MSTFTKCLQLNSFFLEGYIARGNVFMDYGHDGGVRRARGDYQRAIKMKPLCLAARVNLAFALQMSGRLMQAWRNFTVAITLKPGPVPCYVVLQCCIVLYWSCVPSLFTARCTVAVKVNVIHTTVLETDSSVDMCT